MAKCIRCGGSFLTHRKIKIKDAEICSKCFRELGFEKRDELTASLYSFDAIKDGRQAYYRNKTIDSMKEEALSVPLVQFASYGQKRDRNATEHELEMFEVLRELSNAEDLELIRRSDQYVTAAIGDYDLARIKFSPRAKWIMFPYIESKQQKHYIEDPEDVRNFADSVEKSLAVIRKYSGR